MSESFILCTYHFSKMLQGTRNITKDYKLVKCSKPLLKLIRRGTEELQILLKFLFDAWLAINDTL